jgi:hypothetical protein
MCRPGAVPRTAWSQASSCTPSVQFLPHIPGRGQCRCGTYILICEDTWGVPPHPWSPFISSPYIHTHLAPILPPSPSDPLFTHLSIHLPPRAQQPVPVLLWDHDGQHHLYTERDRQLTVPSTQRPEPAIYHHSPTTGPRRDTAATEGQDVVQSVAPLLALHQHPFVNSLLQ